MSDDPKTDADVSAEVPPAQQSQVIEQRTANVDVFKSIWLASCHFLFISANFGVSGVNVHVVYLSITHAVMWFVRYLEPKFARTASYSAAVVSFLLALLALVQFNVCSGTVLECTPVAWRSGAAFVTSIACGIVDLAAVNNSRSEMQKDAKSKSD